MMRKDTDRIALLGEAQFEVAMLNHRIFRTSFLGDKWPVSDYYVELEGFDTRYHFLVQVKATANFSAKNHFAIASTDGNLSRLASYHAPTYFAIVDTKTGEVYLRAATGPFGHPGPGFGPLDHSSSLTLRDEIIRFWEGSAIADYKTRFKSMFV